MAASILPLDPLSFPLAGSHLIEASAGTGKTFTIAMLYVRLVLGHSGKSVIAHGRPYNPPEILVVTFTEAATKELRDRIRARLAEAARLFRADPADAVAAPDDPLQQLRAEYPADAWPACARRLELAAEWMDEAAVSTIHGWCNRMLREHAFDSQSLFSQNLETDASELRAEVVRDYWRIFFYPLSLPSTALIRSHWSGPAALESEVGPLLAHAELLPAGTAPAELLEPLTARLLELKQPWTAWAAELQEIFDQGKASKAMNMNVAWYTSWFSKLAAWAVSPDIPLDIGSGWKNLHPDALTKAWSGKAPQHPGLTALQSLADELAALPAPKNPLLCHATHWIAQAFERAQRQRAQIGFNELLTGLEQALRGSQGERLANLIRQQFPIALIDEFQDTDPVQYRIFERIYDVAGHRQDCALILIGDPKQAIYAFRGADIHTYLQARTAVAGRLYTLTTNFRSTQAMVDATNHCFARAEAAPDSAGAFLFRRGDDNPVPFIQVKARGRQDVLRIAGQTPPAMLLATLEDDATLSKTDYIERMSEICANRIVDWLNQGRTGQAGFVTAGQDLRPLRPADIAILVNNGNEARHIRQSLARRSVRSVYLSDQDTVYATPQAREIQRWLAACAEPDNDRLLRVALCTPSLGLSYTDLDALNVDETAWEARVVQFKAYRECWQSRGVLPMLRRLMRDFGCHERLLALSGDAFGQTGERILTDLLHLAELLQQASFTLEGEHALCRFLAEQIADPAGEADGKKLRLESDADLVQVVTIHKSKGLEYPVVCLPFICAARLTKPDDRPLKWHDDHGKLQISLTASDQIVQRAEADRLGEDLRKLYVALTRARHLNWLGMAPIKNNEPSAIGYLFGLSAASAGEYLPTLRKAVAKCPSIQIIDQHDLTLQRYTPATAPANYGAACRPRRPVHDHWLISSYSSLPFAGKGMAPALPGEDSPRLENLRQGLLEASFGGQPEPVPGDSGGVAAASLRSTHPIHRFFKGADAGTFLHELLESIADIGFASARTDPAGLRELIARRCRIRNWDDWVTPLVDWMQQLLTTPLPLGPAQAPTGFCLADLNTYQVEMEFWFATERVDLGRLDALVSRHTLGTRPRPPLSSGQLNGMLKGFMDLVFEYQGRYYVADYKSNWLGSSDAHYTREAMDEAVRAHRYDLQYAIYLLALHRLLKSRLADYTPERHLGGAVYLFLRGIHGPAAGAHFECPPPPFIEHLDALFAGHEETQDA